MKINTNISAIIANKELSVTESRLSQSLERLSSGLKLNHSEDDAAGMAISQKMKTQLRGIDRAGKNAADGISVIETSEGALTEIHSMLQRMRELAVGAASDSNAVEDRVSIQQEIDSLNEEINRISRDTEFNMQSLLDGNLARRAYTDTTGTKVSYMSDNIPTGDYSVTVTQDAKQACVVGNAIDRNAFANGATADLEGTIKINDIEVSVKEGDSLDSILTSIQKACSYTGSVLIGTNSLNTSIDNIDTAGFSAESLETASNLVIYSENYGRNQEISISSKNTDLLNALGLNEQVAQGKDVEVEFTTANGERVGFDNSATITTQGKEIDIKSVGGFEMKLMADAGVASTVYDATGNVVTSTSKEIHMDVTELGMMVVHIGANEKQQLAIDIPEVTSESLGLEGLNVMTYRLAGDAITRLDSAIGSISTTRSKLGAYQNRLEYSMSNLDVSEENLTASLSRIMDVDMAEEMTEYTQLNVLSQAGISMLSQANARPETVLQLLQ